MRIDYLSSDILVFRGDSLAAVATAFVDGKRVLLIDALASEYDAIEVRDYLERDRGLQIDTVLLTHAGQGHDAGLHVFRGARIEVASAASPSLDWGRHRLDFFPTPGASSRSLAVHVASAELLFVGARIVGAIALIGAASPEQADSALAQLQQRGAQRIVPAYLGVQDGGTLEHAREYLRKLAVQVKRARAAHAGGSLHAAIAAIPIEACLADGVYAGALERHWHRDNLKQIAGRDLFAVPVEQVRAPQRSFAVFIRRTGLVPMLMCMLGRLGRSGV